MLPSGSSPSSSATDSDSLLAPPSANDSCCGRPSQPSVASSSVLQARHVQCPLDELRFLARYFLAMLRKKACSLGTVSFRNVACNRSMLRCTVASRQCVVEWPGLLCRRWNKNNLQIEHCCDDYAYDALRNLTKLVCRLVT